MKHYRITYTYYNKIFFVMLKSDMFPNVYQTFIEKYAYDEVLKIEKLN